MAQTPVVKLRGRKMKGSRPATAPLGIRRRRLKRGRVRDTGQLPCVRRSGESRCASRTAAAASALREVAGMRHCSCRNATMSRQRWRLPSMSMNFCMMALRSPPQYSFGKRKVVALRSDSVMIQRRSSPKPCSAWRDRWRSWRGCARRPSGRCRCWRRPPCTQGPNRRARDAQGMPRGSRAYRLRVRREC